MDDFRAQQQTLDARLRSLSVRVGAHRVDAIVGERVPAGGELLAASRNVLGVEDAGGGGGDGFLEEAAVQHLHGAVDGRGEHVEGRVWHGH